MPNRSNIRGARSVRAIIGLAVWIALGAVLYWTVDQRVAGGAFGEQVAPQIWNYWIAPRPTITLELPPNIETGVGEPLFVQESDGAVRQIGEVRGLMDDTGVLAQRHGAAPFAQVLLYTPSIQLGSDTRVTHHAAANSLPGVVETLLTPERKAELLADLAETWQLHHEEILRAFSPVIEGTLRDVVAVAKQDLPAAMARHRDDWDALRHKYQLEIVEKDLAPLARDEIMPLLQKRAEPTLNEVGKEIWRRVSLWRFGWRIAVDKTVLPKAALTDKEWRRFLHSEVEPILAQHAEDFVKIVEGTIEDAAENERVRETAERVVHEVLDDPDFQRIIRSIAAEVVIDNPRVHEALRKNWTSPEARKAAELAGERFEPVLHRSAERIFGTKQEGVTPEFAQVLRNHILGKDRRWFLLAPGEDAVETPAHTLVLKVDSSETSPTKPFIQIRSTRRNDGRK